MTETKVCTRCKNDLPITEYARDRTTKTGYKSHCRTCRNAAARASRAGAPRVTHNGLTPPKQLRAVANRNALLTLMKRHAREFDELVDFEVKRLKMLDQKPGEKTWINAQLV